MTDLIQRAESAATRDEAVAVFRELHDRLMDLPEGYPIDFAEHLRDARDTKSDTRCYGYLLLAAMAVRDSDIYPILVLQDMGPVIGCGARIGVIDTSAGDMRPVTFDGSGRFLCTALLAAILRANEVQS